MNASPKIKVPQSRRDTPSPTPRAHLPGSSASPRPGLLPKSALSSLPSAKKASDFADQPAKQANYCFDIYDLLILVIVLAQVYFIPFMEAKERFHADATFDLLYPPARPQDWAHLDAKSVPRTLLGSLWLYATVYPMHRLLQHGQMLGYLSPEICLAKVSLYLGTLAVGLMVPHEPDYLMLVRMALGAWTVAALACLRRSIRSLSYFKPGVDRFLALIIASQFHVLYYSSRTLDSTFALIIALFGFAAWLQRHHGRLMAAALMSTLVFRLDFFVLWTSLFLFELIHLRGSQLRKLILYKVCLAPLFLALTVGLDSYFYGRWMWPELESFRSSFMENRSPSDGISMFPWYFTSGLPKALGSTVPWFVLTFLIAPKRWARIGLPALAAVLAFSLLPRKELQSIFPVIPLLDLAAAVSMAAGWQSRYRLLRLALRLLIVGSLAFNLFITGMSLWASAWRYPGGHAAERLHAMESPSAKVWIHRDIYTGLTGESPYGRCNVGWKYDTNENYTRTSDYHQFTHILTESPSLFAADFNVVAQEEEFQELVIPPSVSALAKALKKARPGVAWLHLAKDFAARELVPAKLRQTFSELFVLKPRVFIMKRKP